MEGFGENWGFLKLRKRWKTDLKKHVYNHFFQILMQNQEDQSTFFSLVPKQHVQSFLMPENLSHLGLFKFPQIFPSQMFLFLSQNYLIATQEPSPGTDAYISKLSFDLKISFISEDQVIHKIIQKNPESPLIGFRLWKSQSLSTDFFVGDEKSDLKDVMKKLSTAIIKKGFHDEYKPKKTIAEGHFATVYEAVRQESKKVAVKAFKKLNITAIEKGKEIVFNQIKMLRILDHPGIMKLEGAYETDKTAYIALEFIPGMSLMKIFKKNKSLTKNQIQVFMECLIKILIYMSDMGIAHRDLKPDNIMLKNGCLNDPVIIDFGLATHCNDYPYLLGKCGTPGYIPPEIYKNEKISPACDIYSAGVIFYNLLTNLPLFSGQNEEEIKNKNLTGEYTLNMQKVGSVEADLLHRMLEVDPSKRIRCHEVLGHDFFKQKAMSQVTMAEE